MENEQTYDVMKSRLDEIVEAVSSEDISLDEALALYEEAVKIGLAACDLAETGTEMLDEGEVSPESEAVSEGSLDDRQVTSDVPNASAAADLDLQGQPDDSGQGSADAL